MNLVAGYWYKDETGKLIQDTTRNLSEKSSMKINTDFNSIVEKANVVAAAIMGESGSAKDKDVFKDMFFSRDKDLIYIGIGIKSPSGEISIKNKVINNQFFTEAGIDISIMDKVSADDKKYYVLAKDTLVNTLTVSNNPKYIKDKSSKEVVIKDVNWIAGTAPDLTKAYSARLRYRQALEKCHLKHQGLTLLVSFSKPQTAPASGQSVVIYDGEVCLGGGIII